MAVLAVSALGGYIGGTIGYASAGWVVGSMIGQAIFAEDFSSTQEGPRLDNLNVQTSTYGRDIPKVYGGARIAGNVMWSAGIQEQRHEETTSAGGKGGPEVSSTSVTYSYSASFAIGLCEGPIEAISRIWANGNLIYDFSVNATADAIFSSTQLADGISIYLGSETQTADSLIEAIEGVGNVPGFRGMAYIVFDTLQLEKYGNRIPNITTEVVNNATIVYAGPTVSDRPDYDDNFYSKTDDGLIHFWPGTEFTSSATLTVNGEIYNLSGAKVGDDSISFANTEAPNTLRSNAPIRNSNMYVGYYDDGGGINVACVMPRIALFAANGDRLDTNNPPPYSYRIATAIYYGGAVYMIMGAAQNEEIKLLKFNATTSTIDPHAVVEYTATDSIQDVFVNGDGVYIVQGATSTVEIVKLDFDLNYVNEWIVPATAWSGLYVENDIAILASGTTATYYVVRLNSDGTSTTLETGSASGSGQSMHPIVVGSMLLSREQFITTGLITNTAVALSTIVSDICLKTGLVAGDIDVTALTDTVDGYVSNRETTARGLIEPLQQAFLFDVVESDYKLVFINRGKGSAITVAEDDLGASTGQQRDKITRIRMNEMELPRKLSVVHLDPAADYQENVETAARLITDSVNVKTLSAPLIISVTKAAQMAHILLGRVWIEREQYTGFLPFEYIKANPSDILTVSIDSVTHTILLTEVSYQIPGIIQFRGVAEDTAQYNSNATGASGGFITQTPDIAGPTNLELLDIPLLRDQDNTNGYYIASSGYLSGWSAANLYKSNDSGDTWNNLTTLNRSASMGTTTDALADGIFTIFDYANTVNVRMNNGTLSSSTEAGVLNLANACLIDNEILHFITATLEADGSYTLSGLLRGRKGTEWAMLAHAIGDRFILLDEATLLTLNQNSDEIGIAADYKAVTIGETLQGTSSESFTNNAVRLEPLSPVHINGSRDGSDNLTITWIRRTRIGAAWRDYVDASLGEDSKSYEIDIVSGSPEVVARTITASSETASYTAAQQTSDGFTPGDPVNVKIYQLSATVGRGYAGNATI